MEILTSQLPSGGYGYKFPSVNISPFTFLDLTKYLENVPKDPLEKYLYDIRMLGTEEPKILDCYLMDLDFLIFYKKLCTVSGDLTYKVTVKCPVCGTEIKKRISLEKDVHFKAIDELVMNGAFITLGGHKYETIIPTVRDFLKVFEVYLRYRHTEDLGLIKTIALIKDFDTNGNQIERDVLGATHDDITLLLALRELYYDRVEPISAECLECNKDKKLGDEGRVTVAISIESLIVDFFRDLSINSPIDGTKVLFK